MDKYGQNWLPIGVAKDNKLIKLLVILVFAITILILRRGETLFSPEVWNENGVFMIPEFFKLGWLSLFEPVQGYLISSSRLITNITLTLFPESYPVASAAITWLFMLVVLVSVAFSPLVLKGRVFLALSCLLIPSDPEVFGTPLYSFWWAGILLFLPLFWKPDDSYIKTRIFFTILGGLSSPLIVVVSFLQCFRLFFARRKADLWILVVGGLCSSIQLGYIFSSEKPKPPIPNVDIQFVLTLVDKFLTRFLFEYDINGVVWALLTIMGGVALWFSLKTITPRWFRLIFFLLLGGCVTISVARVPLEVMDPVLAGPRYFFYPYILLFWLLIQGAVSNISIVIRGVCYVFWVLVLHNSFTSGWSRDHDAIEWQKHIHSCMYFPQYNVPIHYTGRLREVWQESYDREFCKVLASDYDYDESELYPFQVIRDVKAYSRQMRPKSNVYTTLNGSSFARRGPDGYRVIGTYKNGDADRGLIRFNLDAESQVYFQSGPSGRNLKYLLSNSEQHFYGRLPVCLEWCILDFSSSLLSGSYTLTLYDSGSEWGQWFAVAAPKK